MLISFDLSFLEYLPALHEFQIYIHWISFKNIERLNLFFPSGISLVFSLKIMCYTYYLDDFLNKSKRLKDTSCLIYGTTLLTTLIQYKLSGILTSD